jgi:hypothetical protein
VIAWTERLLNSVRDLVVEVGSPEPAATVPLDSASGRDSGSSAWKSSNLVGAERKSGVHIDSSLLAAAETSPVFLRAAAGASAAGTAPSSQCRRCKGRDQPGKAESRITR